MSSIDLLLVEGTDGVCACPDTSPDAVTNQYTLDVSYKVTSTGLNKALEYIKAHFGTGGDGPDAPTMSEEELKGFDQKFLAVDHSTLFKIIEVRAQWICDDAAQPVNGRKLLLSMLRNVCRRLQITYIAKNCLI